MIVVGGQLVTGSDATKSKQSYPKGQQKKSKMTSINVTVRPFRTRGTEKKAKRNEEQGDITIKKLLLQGS